MCVVIDVVELKGRSVWLSDALRGVGVALQELSNVERRTGLWDVDVKERDR